MNEIREELSEVEEVPMNQRMPFDIFGQTREPVRVWADTLSAEMLDGVIRSVTENKASRDENLVEVLEEYRQDVYRYKDDPMFLHSVTLELAKDANLTTKKLVKKISRHSPRQQFTWLGRIQRKVRWYGKYRDGIHETTPARAAKRWVEQDPTREEIIELGRQVYGEDLAYWHLGLAMHLTEDVQKIVNQFVSELKHTLSNGMNTSLDVHFDGVMTRMGCPPDVKFKHIAMTAIF